MALRPLRSRLGLFLSAAVHFRVSEANERMFQVAMSKLSGALLGIAASSATRLNLDRFGRLAEVNRESSAWLYFIPSRRQAVVLVDRCIYPPLQDTAGKLGLQLDFDSQCVRFDRCEFDLHKAVLRRAEVGGRCDWSPFVIVAIHQLP